jgi:hypothetical protein
MPFHWTTSFNNLDGSPILTIKPTGELVPGPGLSDDEVSKRLASALVGTLETYLKQSVSQSMADEIERLREALRVIADGDAPREHAIIYRSDGVHSKHDKCKHGAWMYDGCEDCVTEYARAALGEGKE